MQSCASSTLKYLIFFFNFVFALGGLAILICGAILQSNITYFNDFLDAQLSTAPIILIVVGSIIFVIAFFGCCGAIRESHCMVITFAILLLIIFIIQLTGGILAFTYEEGVGAVLKEAMKELQKIYYTDDLAKEAWDTVQRELKCCGVESNTEWLPTFPKSCSCDDPNFYVCIAGIYTNGCYDKLKDFVRSAQIILGGVAIGFAVVELIGVVSALCLASSIKKMKR